MKALTHVPLSSLLSTEGRRKISSLSYSSKLSSPAASEKLPPLWTLKAATTLPNFFLQWTFVQNNPSNFFLSSMKECSLHLLSRLPYGHIVCLLSSVQSLSRVRLSVTPWTAACQAFLTITNSWSLLKLMSIKSMMPSNHLILCHPLLLPSIFPSIRVFSNESVLRIRWPKYWSFSFSISPSIEYSRLISFRIDWLDLLMVQETLKSLLQQHSSKASILWCSAFFMVHIVCLYQIVIPLLFPRKFFFFFFA